jgi:hypothetical protein
LWETLVVLRDSEVFVDDSVTDLLDLRKEVRRLHIKVTLLEKYLKAAMSLPILGIDSEEYEKALHQALAKEDRL